MTISDRIFERIRQLSMTQKEFAEKAGIQQSTISEWKKNRTNPSSDKILAICKALDVSPEWLLSGIDPAASRAKNQEYYVVDLTTDTGLLVSKFNQLDKSQRDRILGYVEAFSAMNGGNGGASRSSMDLRTADGGERERFPQQVGRAVAECNPPDQERSRNEEQIYAV